GARGAAAAALVWAALPTAALYAATGLETAAFALALWGLGAAVAGGRSRPAGAFAALAATLRPEGMVLAVGALPFRWRLGSGGRAGATCCRSSSSGSARWQPRHPNQQVPPLDRRPSWISWRGAPSSSRSPAVSCCWPPSRSRRLFPSDAPGAPWPSTACSRAGGRPWGP